MKNAEFNVRLKRDARYPAHWVSVSAFPPYKAGTVVPVVPATNQPDCESKGLVFINTPELKDDCYGILLDSTDYDRIP